MKDKINQKMGLLMLLAALIISCNSKPGSEKKANLSSGFNESALVDVEKLSNTMEEDLLDSAGVEIYLEEALLPAELKKYFLSFYQERAYAPAWIQEEGLSSQAIELLKAIEKSPEQGLQQEDYKLKKLHSLKEKVESQSAGQEDLRRLDKEYTAAYLKLANHILRGRLNPEKLDALWVTSRREKDLAAHLSKAIESGELGASLEALEPNYSGYRDLKTALAAYKKIEEQQHWKSLPQDLVLRKGDTSTYVPQLAQMLHVMGDLPEKWEGNAYGPELAGALALFQERHGLVADSIVAENTLGMLNIPAKQRVEQLKLNMERFRWLPDRPGGRHVVVNVPEYRMYVYEGGDSVLNMRVIVGEAYKSTTPIFNDSIEYIAFSPTWTVPLSICREEMLPKIKKDPGYLAKRNFKLYESWSPNAKELDPFQVDWEKIDPDNFQYCIVQQPGPSNSLGRVKFMFPNEMDIYLHDTPADYLFDRNERDFSHGCIRVERPAEFAHYLLQEKGLGLREIGQKMNLPEPENIILAEKVPVFIEYRTAWMGPDGKVHFREDIYGHDQTQIGKLKAIQPTGAGEGM